MILLVIGISLFHYGTHYVENVPDLKAEILLNTKSTGNKSRDWKFHNIIRVL